MVGDFHLHKYLVIIAFIMLILTYIYIYVKLKRVKLNEQEKNILESYGVFNTDDVTHDDDMWYYKDVSTCVGYGKEKDKCLPHERVCGDENTYGNIRKQLLEVYKSILNKGKHEACPLIYEGAN